MSEKLPCEGEPAPDNLPARQFGVPHPLTRSTSPCLLEAGGSSETNPQLSVLAQVHLVEE